MSFEIKEKDLFARIGRLKTKSGTVETPLLFPVINPVKQLVPTRKMREEFGFEALITNAYLLKKHIGAQLKPNGLHDFLDFEGTIMTDSGAYQILVYGDVEVTPKEIVEFQETIGSDIATILDIPTGWKVTKEHAEKTVNETWKRAMAFFKQKTREDILWVGPVQGGRHLDLVAKSAQQMGKLPFEIHALGSPTEVMERYRFDVLVDMIMTAKMNLPIEKPLHLFGAGHPFMLALAVALGCDFFDSAAYALYAKQGRYMTETGTSKLNELEYFQCTCPKCAKSSPKELSEMPPEKVQMFLAEHNLYVTMVELKRIKQAIKDGRLWEHMQMRAHSHPSLLSAIKQIKKFEEHVEKHDVSVKSSGLLQFDSMDLMRPEVVRYRKKLAERYVPPKSPILLLAPQTKMKPFHKSIEFRERTRHLKGMLESETNVVHICFYAAPFGVVPFELDEIYPLSQNETVTPPDSDTRNYVADQVAEYISRAHCKSVILLDDPENWGETIRKKVQAICKSRKIKFRHVEVNKNSKITSQRLDAILQQLRKQA
jgi:7-cyano-7-deazaguanine tRNA-ribosyltransferase